MTNILRKDFPLLGNVSIAYLDNAATAQRTKCDIDAEAEFYRKHNDNPQRGLYTLSAEATGVYEDASEAVRAVIGAKGTEEHVVNSNTTCLIYK